MIAGVVVALGWMIAGKPMGIHGFIPGVVVSLVVFVGVSLFTEPPDAALIRRAWGEE
jgi:Na+/proline symporter